jgi:RHS repeat-associated protein
VSNAAHGREYELDHYATNGTTLLSRLKTQWQPVCPPSGVGASPPVTFNDQLHMGTYTWDGHLVSELDPGNPVAACDVLKVRSDQITVDGTSARRHPDLVTTDAYDSFGRVTTESTVRSVTVADSSDIASNEPTWSGGVSFGAPGAVPGDQDTAMTFDGSTGYLATSPPTAAATGSLTMEAWINKSSQTVGPILEYNTGNTIGAHLWNFPTWDGLYVNFLDTHGAAHTLQSPAGQFVTGTWYHVVATYDGTLGTLYVNGNQVAQANLGSFTPQTSFPLNVARRPSGSPNVFPNTFFAGSIDEAAVYFSALSAARVQAHHSAGAAYQQTVMADTPFSYYRMDEPTPAPSIVKQHGYATNDAVTTTPTSATGQYLVDYESFNDTEDGTGSRFQCTYTGYDGQPFVQGQTSGLTLGEATTIDRYTKCGDSSNGFTPRGQIRTSHTYDAFGNMVTTSDPDANAGNTAHLGCHVGTATFSTCTAYDASFGVLATSNANALNQTSTNGYTAPGTGASGGFGLWPVSHTDANGQTTSLAYDALGRQIGMTLPGETAGLTTQATGYTVWCSGTAAQSPCTEIDHTQRLNSTTTVTSRAFYDGLGHLVETRSPAPGGQDVVRYTFYDPSQRQVLQSVPYLVTAYTGGPGPAAYSIPDSTQAGASSTYDGLGRVTSTTDALSNRSATAYSTVCGPAGVGGDFGCYSQTLAVDANQHQTGTLVDTFGRTAYVQRYTGNSPASYAVYATATYVYDTVGNLVTIKQPDTGTSTRTNFDYDMAGRKTAMTDPDLGAQTYTYDQDGNLVQSVDARGSAGTVFMGYDGLDRPIWRNTTNSPTGAYDIYVYDSTASGNVGIGHLTSETFSAGALSGSYAYGYDARGQQTSSTLAVGSTGYPLRATYDDAGNVLTQAYPDGETVTNGYTAQGWLSSVATSAGSVTLANNLAYTGTGGAFGEVTAMHLGGGYDYSASYDLLDRAFDLKTRRTSDGTTVFDQSRTFDTAGNVSTASTTMPAGTDNQSFCYDEQDRLTWASSATATPPCGGTNTAGTLSAAQYTQSFGYDVMGRLTSGPLGSYTYGSSAHVHAATSIGTGWTAGYDASGNMTCRAPSGTSTCAGTQTGAQLGYNNEGELQGWQNAPNSPTTTTAFLYDGQGQRVVQAVAQGGTTTTTVYVGGVEEVATSGSTTTTTAYYYARSKRIGLSVNGTVSYLASDGLGSANVTLNGSGTATASQLYAPYGGARYSSGSMPTSFGFTGQRADIASGLDYYGARYYDPFAGQFTSGDSVVPGGGFDLWGLSRYAYVEGNPINRTDPTGHRNQIPGNNGGTCDITDPSCGGGQPDPTPPSGGGGTGPGGHSPCWMTGGECSKPTPTSPPPPDQGPTPDRARLILARASVIGNTEPPPPIGLDPGSWVQTTLNADVGAFDYGTEAAAFINFGWGSYKLSTGLWVLGAAIVGSPVEVALPIVGWVAGGAVLAYGGYQTTTGAAKVVKAYRQAFQVATVPTHDRTVGANLTRFWRGVVPFTGTRWSDNVLGDLP